MKNFDANLLKIDKRSYKNITDENEELLKKWNNVFNGIRDEIKGVCGDERNKKKD